MTLSIIIPTHKRSYQVVELLKSIAEQEFPYEDLQVLLISNLKDKELRKQSSYWERIFFDFKYKELACLGVNKARNMGIRFSGGNILYFLDDDCVLPHKNHLKNLILEHEKNPSIIGIGGGYRSLTVLQGIEKFYHENTQKWIEDSMTSKQEVFQLIGGNSSYKREVFDKGFYFDPLIVFGGSEESFNQALKDAGYTLSYKKDLWVFHVLKLNLFSLIKKSFTQGLGLFKNRYKSEQNIQKLQNLKQDWAFLIDNLSFYPFVYSLFFKLGYFWGLASLMKEKFIFRIFYFVFLIIKSRLFFLKEYVFPLASSLFLRVWGLLRYGLGWIYGDIFLRVWGLLRYGLGWIYGDIFLRVWGLLRYGLGWFYGDIFLRVWGLLRYGLGWIYGDIFLRVWGLLRYGLGWIYGDIFLRVWGLLRYGLGWFYGDIFLRVWGLLRYGLGWFYGHVLVFLWHHSPPMKIYYFSKYQYYKRIKSFLHKIKKKDT